MKKTKNVKCAAKFRKSKNFKEMYYIKSDLFG